MGHGELSFFSFFYTLHTAQQVNVGVSKFQSILSVYFFAVQMLWIMLKRAFPSLSSWKEKELLYLHFTFWTVDILVLMETWWNEFYFESHIPFSLLAFSKQLSFNYAQVRAVCKPLKALGIHTVSLHPGASLEHQIHGYLYNLCWFSVFSFNVSKYWQVRSGLLVFIPSLEI